MRDLHAAAADVDQDAVLDGNAVDGAQEAESGLHLAADDLDVEAALAAQTRYEGVAIGGLAHGGGGDGDGAPRAAAARDGLEALQRQERALDDRLAQRAAVDELVHQPQRRTQGVEHIQVAEAIDAHDLDAAAVRADVDDGQHLAIAAGGCAPGVDHHSVWQRVARAFRRFPG